MSRNAVLVVVCLAVMFCRSDGAVTSKGKSTVPSNYFAQHDLCEHEIAAAERKYGIPHRLLMAIGTVESGRAVAPSKGKRPWPWTVCANGKSYYFSTKGAAIATVKRLMGRGIRNIDVGCMQVNLLHHSKAFKDLEEAFTPRNNVKYAAEFFLKLKNLYHSWTHAVGYYHSKSALHYKPYCSLVYDAWTKVRNRVINESKKVCMASAKIRTGISFLPSYYSLADNKVTAKLHQLGRRSLHRKAPKFFTSLAK